MGVDGGGGVEEGMMLARRSESVDLGSCRDVLACSWVTGGADPSGWFQAGVKWAFAEVEGGEGEDG